MSATLWASSVLAAAIVVGGLIWMHRHCLKRTAWERLGFGAFTGAAAMMCAIQFARVSPHLDALRGNVREAVLCLLLFGGAVMVWAKALERKR